VKKIKVRKQKVEERKENKKEYEYDMQI